MVPTWLKKLLEFYTSGPFTIQGNFKCLLIKLDYISEDKTHSSFISVGVPTVGNKLMNILHSLHFQLCFSYSQKIRGFLWLLRCLRFKARSLNSPDKKNCCVASRCQVQRSSCLTLRKIWHLPRFPQLVTSVARGKEHEAAFTREVTQGISSNQWFDLQRRQWVPGVDGERSSRLRVFIWLRHVEDVSMRRGEEREKMQGQHYRRFPLHPQRPCFAHTHSKYTSRS